MLQPLLEQITFDEFIEWYPENTTAHYELYQGVIVEMPKPKGKHSQIAGNLVIDFGSEIRRLDLPYFIPKESVIKIPGEESGYEPDAIVLDTNALPTEPRWEKSSVIQNGSTIKLIVEVVSTNWQDDYDEKFNNYEAMGIPEFWIVDYLGIGGRRYIGNPKQPTLTLCTLVNGVYETQLLRGDDRIPSPTFPDLNLTAQQVLAL